MTEKEAVLLTLKVWIWLFQNPKKDKEDSFFWNDIELMTSYCPLCEFYHVKCSKCFLSIGAICGRDTLEYTVYEKYVDSDYEKRYSAVMAWTIRRYAQKKGWLEK